MTHVGIYLAKEVEYVTLRFVSRSPEMGVA